MNEVFDLAHKHFCLWGEHLLTIQSVINPV